MQKLKLLGLLSLLVMIGIACGNQKKTTEKIALPEGNHKVEVLEVVQATSYTYLNVEEQGSEFWIAVSKQIFSVGDVIYYTNGLEMHDFESKDLQRTFDVIYFVERISDVPILSEQEQRDMLKSGQAPKPVLEKMDITVEKPEGGVTIGELYSNMAEYKDKTVLVRGKVTKVNLAIMSRNWIHIQDGTGDETHFDLTVTTQHIPKIDDVITYWGKVSVNKDFGMGYTYELILEEAEPME